MSTAASSERQAHLLGRVTISGTLVAKTGLHVGGSDRGIEVGGVDKVVIRNALDGRPYLPGSSLKGKMRSLIERARGLEQNHDIKRGRDRMSTIKMHSASNQRDYDSSAVCNLFGVPSNWEDKNNPPYPTRLIVRDAPLTDASAEDLLSKTEMPYTEGKTEVGIDRLTSAANPRTFERVPMGAEFAVEFVVNFYSERDAFLLNTLLFGLGLLEGDYLGGQGSRGYGKVSFKDLSLRQEPFVEELELPKWTEKLLAPNKASIAELPWQEFVQEDGFAAGLAD